jgi:putative transposase
MPFNPLYSRLIEGVHQMGAASPHPGAHPRVISDNGSQFIAGDFRRFIDLAGLTHVRTSVNYPQANGKIERYHRTLDKNTIHAVTPDGAHW